MDLVRMHTNLLFTILFVCAGLTLWATIGFVRRNTLSAHFYALLAIGELLLLAEFCIGALIFLQGMRPARLEPHIMYGVVAIVILPAAHLFARGRAGRQPQAIYALSSLFLCAIVLRALQTAR